MPAFRNRRTAAGIALIAATILAGCGAPPQSDAPIRSVATGPVGPSRGALELAAPRRAALGFAASYVASANDPRRPVAHSATAQLARELRGNAATNGQPHHGPPLRLRGLALAAKTGGRVEATMTLGAGNGPSFAVVFLLQSYGRRWLAARLLGN